MIMGTRPLLNGVKPNSLDEARLNSALSFLGAVAL